MPGERAATSGGRPIVGELGLALSDTPFEVDRDASGPDRVVFRVRGGAWWPRDRALRPPAG